MAELQSNSFRQILERDFTEEKLLDRPPRLATGFPRLDELLGGGISPGLIVLGASPGLGKSTFALQLARNVSAGGTPVLYFSLEMPQDRITAKLLSREAFQTAGGAGETDRAAAMARFFTADDILNVSVFGQLGAEKKVLFEQTCRSLLTEENELIIESGPHLNAEEIVKTARDFAGKANKRPLVIVDYLQIIPPKSDTKILSDRQLVENNLKQMVALAHEENGLPVLLISSLNRASYKDKLQMDSFKETGGIEYSADVLLGLQFSFEGKMKSALDVTKEKNRFPRQMEINILKQRYGRTGETVPFRYYAEFDHFEEAPPVLPVQSAEPVASDTTVQRAPMSLSLGEETPTTDLSPQQASEPSHKKVFLHDPARKADLPPPGLANLVNNTLVANDLRRGRKGKAIYDPDSDDPNDPLVLPLKRFENERICCKPLRGAHKDVETEVIINGELDRFDLYVADAAYSILYAIQNKTNDIPRFSLHQLLKVLTGDERPTLTGQRRQLLADSIQRLRSTQVRIDCTQEFSARGFAVTGAEQIFAGPFLNVKEDGKYYRFVQSPREPDPMPLYAYAQQIKQIVNFPSGLLRIGTVGERKTFSDTRETIMIKRLLAQRVEILRSGKGDSTENMDKISYISGKGKGFMADLGYSDRLKGDAWRKKRDDTHEVVLKVLDRFKDVGYIQGYTVAETENEDKTATREVTILREGIRKPHALFKGKRG